MKKIISILSCLCLFACQEPCETQAEQVVELQTNYFLFQCIQVSDDGQTWKEVEDMQKLPLSQGSDYVYYVFHEGTNKDTLEINYQRQLEYKDDECGMYLHYQNIQIVKNTFSSEIDVNIKLEEHETQTTYSIELNHILF
jgi:hypothetical protein